MIKNNLNYGYIDISNINENEIEIYINSFYGEMPSHDTYEDINNETITIININETSSNEEDKIKLYIVEISMILIIIIFLLLINI